VRSVSVNHEKLLARLKGGRKKHYEAYKIAYRGWLTEMAEEIENATLLINDAIDDGDEGIGEMKAIKLSTPPRNYLEDYDVAIDMIECGTEQNYELSATEFRQYMRDEWEWKLGFGLANAKYEGFSHAYDGGA